MQVHAAPGEPRWRPGSEAAGGCGDPSGARVGSANVVELVVLLELQHVVEDALKLRTSAVTRAAPASGEMCGTCAVL